MLFQYATRKPKGGPSPAFKRRCTCLWQRSRRRSAGVSWWRRPSGGAACRRWRTGWCRTARSGRASRPRRTGSSARSPCTGRRSCAGHEHDYLLRSHVPGLRLHTEERRRNAQDPLRAETRRKQILLIPHSILNSPLQQQTSAGVPYEHAVHRLKARILREKQEESAAETSGSQGAQDLVDIRRVGLDDHEELGPGQRLEAVQVERVRVQHLDAGAARRRRQLPRDRVQRVPAQLASGTAKRDTTAQGECQDGCFAYLCSRQMLICGRQPQPHQMLARRKVSLRFRSFPPRKPCKPARLWMCQWHQWRDPRASGWGWVGGDTLAGDAPCYR